MPGGLLHPGPRHSGAGAGAPRTRPQPSSGPTIRRRFRLAVSKELSLRLFFPAPGEIRSVKTVGNWGLGQFTFQPRSDRTTCIISCANPWGAGLPVAPERYLWTIGGES